MKSGTPVTFFMNGDDENDVDGQAGIIIGSTGDDHQDNQFCTILAYDPTAKQWIEHDDVPEGVNDTPDITEE